MNNNEKEHYNLRISAYNYIKNYLTQFYDFCYIENGIFYIDVEVHQIVKKYILDEYVKNIQYSKFFAGFIEINAISKILNRPIFVLENLIYEKENIFYSKIAFFNNSENDLYNLDDIIFINLINKDHYQLLKPNKEFIINRIQKKTLIEYNLINFDRKNKTIFDICNNKGSMKDNLASKLVLNNDKSDYLINDEKGKSNIKINSVKNIISEANLEKSNPKTTNNQEDIQEINNEILDNFENKEYLNIIKNYENRYIEINETEKIIIPKYPILVGNKIKEDYYADIYRYLYIEKYNLNLFRYPKWVNNINRENTRDNKKKDLRAKYKKYYLDEKNKLYKKLEINLENNSKVNVNAKSINIGNVQYLLLYIPETLEILTFLYELHKEDGHKGITSLRHYLLNNNIYLEGSTYLTDYIVKNCSSCSGKNKSKLKREPSKQIITYYPRQRYIMDITELPIELKVNSNFTYLFNIIDHFSKFGIYYLTENKEAKTIYKYLKLALEYNGFPSEIGSDNGKEFKNSLIETFLQQKNINYIHGMPYNPHSQGVVERFHKTVKDGLYCQYIDDPEKFDIQLNLDILIKKYNNHIHSSTKFTPNEIFYSKNEDLFKTVLSNIKASFNKRENEIIIFKDNEKCLINKKFKIKKKGNNEKFGIIIKDKIKNKNLYGKINITILSKSGNNYKIKIAKDYDDLDLFEEDLYIVDYRLLSKCTEKLWLSLLKKDNNNQKDIILDDILNSEYSLEDEEIDFIKKNKEELK